MRKIVGLRSLCLGLAAVVLSGSVTSSRQNAAYRVRLAPRQAAGLTHTGKKCLHGVFSMHRYRQRGRSYTRRRVRQRARGRPRR